MGKAFGIIVRWLAVGFAAAAVAACNSPATDERGPVVLAAASLQEALSEAAAAWEAAGHAKPVLSFAATSALARQIEQGAPADLFISADEDWMDSLQDAGQLQAGTRRDLLTNRLVLVAARGGAVANLEALGDGKLALADPAAVPAGKYARAALESVGQWADLADNVVPAENVRAALALVERGEAPLGIVYSTDALASDGVEVVDTLPASSHPPIRYPGAILAASRNSDAKAFLIFLASPQAGRIFRKYCFGIAE
jgi:molybdate transport system substrate-binding protein